MYNVSMNDIWSLTYFMAASQYDLYSLPLLGNEVRNGEQFAFLPWLSPVFPFQDPVVGRVIDLLV